MLRKILSQIEAGFFSEQGIKLVQDTVSFSQKVDQLLREAQGLKDFFGIAEIMVGEDARLGGGAILLFLKNTGKFDLWLSRILKSLDREFCLASADLLIKRGGD